MNLLLPNHPAYNHFPIGFLAAALLLEVLGLWWKRESLHEGGRWLLFAGTLAALVAVATGLWAEKLVEPAPLGLALVLGIHKTLAFVMASGAVLLSMWRVAMRKKYSGGERVRFVFLLGALVGLSLYTAHLGGIMVYDHGAGVTVGKRTLGSKGLPAGSLPARVRPDSVR